MQKLPFHDHNAPALRWLVRFCQNATHFLNCSPQNVVAIHCQGGKGRTGLFAAALMLWTQMKPTAALALDEFAQRRTAHMKRGHSVQGVTGPGQVRTCVYICVNIHIYRFICVYIDLYTCIRVCVCVYVNMCMCVSKYIHM